MGPTGPLDATRRRPLLHLRSTGTRKTSSTVTSPVNDTDVRDRAREKLYVGKSRATDQLIVVGDPAVVREMGGPGVANRLGLT